MHVNAHTECIDLEDKHTYCTPSMVDSNHCGRSLDRYAVHTEASCHREAHTHVPSPAAVKDLLHVQVLTVLCTGTMVCKCVCTLYMYKMK